MLTDLAYAAAISTFAYAVHWYRAGGLRVSPDGQRYLAMGQGVAQPQPYSRRWLLPRLCGASITRWWMLTGLAFVACGPLVYELTGSLECVWLFVWLPGVALNVRFPVLTDQVAMALVLGAAVALKHDHEAIAGVLLMAAGHCKESAPLFGIVLAPSIATVLFGVMGTLGAMAVAAFGSAPPDAKHQVSPFRVARSKHDPLAWKSMLLPWGAIAALACMRPLELDRPAMLACLSLVLGYGQLLIANDEVRLYQWAAPAVLVALAPHLGGPLLVPLLVVHPFLCAAGRQT